VPVPPSPTSSGGEEIGFGFGGLPLLRFGAGSPVALSSGTFLGCGRKITRHQNRTGGAWGCGWRWWGGRISSGEHTLGGLPLFRFSPAPVAGATSDVEAAVSAALFLFLLPLGRPRPRLAGGDAPPKGGTRRFVSTRDGLRRALSIVGGEEMRKGTDLCPRCPPVEHPLRAH
jgi:hypothetical protein